MIIEIPGRRPLTIDHVVFDLNGTLAVDGEITQGMSERLRRLKDMYSCHIATAGTHGDTAAIAAQTGIEIELIDAGHEAEQKRRFVAALGSHQVAAIGNGANDRAMLEEAAIAVAVCGAEGMCVELLRAADILVSRQEDALDLFLDPVRIVATLRS